MLQLNASGDSQSCLSECKYTRFPCNLKVIKFFFSRSERQFVEFKDVTTTLLVEFIRLTSHAQSLQRTHKTIIEVFHVIRALSYTNACNFEREM